MEFRLLGPLEVVDTAGPLPLGGGKARALLALLLLNAERAVPVERLVDDLWGSDVPETASKMIQIHVSHLRKTLPPGVLETRSPGYRVALQGHELDLVRFEQLSVEGRAAASAGRHDEAAFRLGEALALWRGPALAEFAEPFARAEAPRLEEQRLACLEGRIDADLALGRSASLVGELETLVLRHPLRERLRRQQMLALYASGRHAEALAAYTAYRTMLADELGIEPSEGLRELERRMLRQDAGLGAVALDARSPTPPSAALRERAPVAYARSDDLSIAFQVTGGGSTDIVLVPGFVSHLEKDWEHPGYARFLERVGALGRLVRFDKRGTGLSDRPTGVPDLETRMDDVRAVMDAAGSETAVVLGYSEGAPMAVLFAATYPERVTSLVLVGGYAKRQGPDDDYPWAATPAERAAYIDSLEGDWGFERQLRRMCPNADAALAAWWGERCRAAVSPGALRALMEMNSRIDVRDVLPAIHVPTLVVHREEDGSVLVDEGRYLGRRIPGAEVVVLPGADHFVGVDPDQILDVVEAFVRQRRPVSRAVGWHLTTILVARLAGAADAVARSLVERAEHELARYAARHVGGDRQRLVAQFDGPSRAVRCGLALRDALRSTGVEVAVGIHTGEVEGYGADLRGAALEVADQVAAVAAPGEVVVSSTTHDLVEGAGLAFEERADRPLEGADRVRRLFTAEHR